MLALPPPSRLKRSGTWPGTHCTSGFFGDHRYQIFHTRYAMGIHGYILMYSIVSRRSFDMVSTIRDKLLNAVGTEDIPHVLVQNPPSPKKTSELDPCWC